MNEELGGTPEQELKKKLLAAVKKYSPQEIELEEEAAILAGHYLSGG